MYSTSKIRKGKEMKKKEKRKEDVKFIITQKYTVG
jgi:hypothetical protein